VRKKDPSEKPEEGRGAKRESLSIKKGGETRRNRTEKQAKGGADQALILRRERGKKGGRGRRILRGRKRKDSRGRKAHDGKDRKNYKRKVSRGLAKRLLGGM